MHCFVFFLVFVFAVGKVRMIAIDLEHSAIPEGCFLPGYICSMVGMEGLPGTFNTPEDCYLACKETDETEGSDCKYWTYWKTQNQASCYSSGTEECIKLVSHCGPSADDDSYCASGTVDCAEIVHKTAIQPEYSEIPDKCWFHDHVCAITGLDELTEGGPYETPEACYGACKAINDANKPGEECKFWTFWTAQAKTNCYSTGSNPCVEEVVHCGPDVDSPTTSSCISGPGTCDDTPGVTCDHLKLAESLQNKVVWTCPVLDNPGFDPYIDSIPVDTKCSAECSVWTDSGADSENHRVSSTCTDDGGTGTWSALDPETVTDADGNPLPLPDVEGNPSCGCKTIKIKANESPEAGMELFCTDDHGDLALQDLTKDVTITSDTRCIMFCDRHLALDIECTQGVWSENIEDCTDIYCWKEPTTEECAVP